MKDNLTFGLCLVVLVVELLLLLVANGFIRVGY